MSMFLDIFAALLAWGLAAAWVLTGRKKLPLALPDEIVLKVLALVTAETLAAGSALVEAAGVVLKPDVGGYPRRSGGFIDPFRLRPQA